MHWYEGQRIILRAWYLEPGLLHTRYIIRGAGTIYLAFPTWYNIAFIYMVRRVSRHVYGYIYHLRTPGLYSLLNIGALCLLGHIPPARQHLTKSTAAVFAPTGRVLMDMGRLCCGGVFCFGRAFRRTVVVNGMRQSCFTLPLIV